VRVPNHPLTLKLLNSLEFPLAAPSANPFGSISPTTAAHVETYFGEQIKMILDGGPCISGIESTIVGFENENPIILRLGSTSIEAIEDLVGPVNIKNYSEQQPLAPGMLKRHYAPKTKIVITDNLEKTISRNSGKSIGVLSFKDPLEDGLVTKQIVLSLKGDLEEAATKLYSALHDLDRLHLDLIITECFPDNDLGRSINDRLGRATQ
jgi:L-threonylcarbamoyladenylate synthase